MCGVGVGVRERERGRERETRGRHHPPAHDRKQRVDREKRDGLEAGVTTPPTYPVGVGGEALRASLGREARSQEAVRERRGRSGRERERQEAVTTLRLMT